MSLPTLLKKGLTIVLVGESGENSAKMDLLLILYGIWVGKSADDFYETKISPPSASPQPNNSLLYNILRTNGDTKLELKILDTPAIGETASEVQVAGVVAAIKNSNLEMVDAIIIVENGDQALHNPNIPSIVDKLQDIFARPIIDNVYLVLMEGPRSTQMDRLVELPEDNLLFMKNLLSHARESQLAANNWVKDNKEKAKGIRRKFDRVFDDAKEDIEKLWKYVDECPVQASDMRNLYRKGINIESQISAALAEQKFHTVKDLVHEYSLFATSPDFEVHLKCLIELLNPQKERAGVTEAVQKLEAIRGGMDNAQDFPKGFVVYDSPRH